MEINAGAGKESLTISFKVIAIRLHRNNGVQELLYGAYGISVGQRTDNM